jgi:hypothetical protein
MNVRWMSCGYGHLEKVAPPAFCLCTAQGWQPSSGYQQVMAAG